MNDNTPDTAAQPVILTSRHPYAETITRLSAALSAAGNTIFATIDQRAAARSAGLELRPTTLLIFGNPRGGTPLMDAAPLFALELPLKFLIWEDAANVNVAYNRPSTSAARYGVAGNAPQLAALDRALATFAAAVT